MESVNRISFSHSISAAPFLSLYMACPNILFVLFFLLYSAINMNITK